MGRTPLLILLFALTLSSSMLAQADDDAANLEASTFSFESTERTSGSATTAVSTVADPFDVFLILTLSIGIAGLISVRRYVKS